MRPAQKGRAAPDRRAGGIREMSKAGPVPTAGRRLSDGSGAHHGGEPRATALETLQRVGQADLARPGLFLPNRPNSS